MKAIFNFFALIFVILNVSPVMSQTIAISGYVLNKNTGAIVKNVSVFESVEGIGTISNKNGFYKLLLNPGEKDFKISDSGYETFIGKFDLKKDTTLMVQLKPIEKGNDSDSKHTTENIKKKNK